MLRPFCALMWWVRGCVLCLTLSALLTHSAYSFESGEHCGIANLAARIAFDFVARHEKSAERKAEIAAARDMFEPKVGATACFPASWTHPENFEFSYGKVTALVDYVNNPNDLLLRYGHVTGYSKTPAELSEVYFENSASLVGRFSVASHNNVDHFQGLLLSSFKFWHDSAVDEGNHTGGLFEALVKSAIADHFLQDFFAPGHMITPRDGFPDIAALSWHDHYNELGMPLTVWDLEALRPLIEFVRNASPSDKTTLNSYFESIGAYRTKQPSATQRVTLVDAITQLEGLHENRCPKDHGDHAALPALAAVANGRSVEEGRTDRILCVYGDGMLDGHASDSERSIPAQKALMTLVEAMYIASVLEDGANPHPRPTEYRWCPRVTTIEIPWRRSAQRGAEASQGAQCVQLLEEARRLCVAGECSTHSIPTQDVANLCSADPAQRVHGCREFFASPLASIDVVSYALQPAVSPNPYIVFDPIFALSVGFRNGKGVESGGAGTWAIETVPIGLVGARDFIRDRNFHFSGMPTLGLALGYEGAFGGSDAFRHAYTGRLVWAIARLDTQVSLLAERVHVSRLPLTDSGWGVGGRFEVGFSFLTAFVQATREPTIQNNDRAEGLVLKAGVSLSFSSGRALHLLEHYMP